MRKELNCSMFRALDALGDRWTLMVLREAFMGVRRFTDMQRDLGVARNVLTDRLNFLVDTGILERRQYQERPVRHEYRLTDMGRDLWPSIVALLQFGDKHLATESGPPMLLLHKGCGGDLDDRRVCRSCGTAVELRDVEAVPGPGGARIPAAA